MSSDNSPNEYVSDNRKLTSASIASQWRMWILVVFSILMVIYSVQTEVTPPGYVPFFAVLGLAALGYGFAQIQSISIA